MTEDGNPVQKILVGLAELTKQIYPEYEKICDLFDTDIFVNNIIVSSLYNKLRCILAIKQSTDICKIFANYYENGYPPKNVDKEVLAEVAHDLNDFSDLENSGWSPDNEEAQGFRSVVLEFIHRLLNDEELETSDFQQLEFVLSNVFCNLVNSWYIYNMKVGKEA